MKFTRIVILQLLFTVSLIAQQNQQLYFMHNLGESNYLNPAVQSSCKWFIGLPVISSVHFNYANSAFSYNELVEPTSDSTSTANIDKVINRMGRRPMVGTEVHVNLFTLGYKKGDHYFNFSITEKNNLPVTVAKEVLALMWQGNTQYEGTSASLRGTSLYPIYYREYALGYSRLTKLGNYLGIKGKLLFGKLNASSPVTNADLYTDANSFDLRLTGEIKANLSGPFIINQTNGNINSITYDNSVSPMQVLFNRKNWGIAIDAGFITYPTSKLMIAGSILDLGFIRWRSYLNNIETNADYPYTGPLGDTTATTDFIGHIRQAFADSITYTITNGAYNTLMPTKAYLGIQYELNNTIRVSAVGSAIAYPTKVTPALTFTANINPSHHFHTLISYSLMNRSIKNLGLGFTVGRNPFQFYMISDNVLGLIWPLSAHTVNLRFGLNMNLGCSTKQDSGFAPGRSSSCMVYKSSDVRNQRKAKWRK